jgi:putative FmdB family regulatory protein
MPLYGYACATCGPFAAMRPIAQYRAPAPCPVCGAEAQRVVSAPALLGRSQRDADGASPPRGAATSAARLKHSGGCRCC